MDISQFRIAFLCLFFLGLAVELLLNALNRREVIRNVNLPRNLGGFAGISDSETYAKSRNYTLERLSFDTYSLFFSAVGTMVFLFSGVLPWFDRILLRLFGDGLNRGAFFLFAVIAVPFILKLPFSLYSTFRIEGKYGFNTVTWALFWRDLIKGLALSLALGLPVLYALLFFMRQTGPAWWIWAFGLIFVFQITLMVAYPTLIAPFFNRFQPLEDGDLRTSLLAMANRLRFPAADIYVMDGSRRSLHSNAYFTGLGKWRRIVLFDTLLRQMENPELLSILAHEIGHYKRKHIYKRMAVQILILGGILYLASLALHWAPLYGAFGFEATTAGPAIGIFLFLTVFASLSFFFAPLGNWTSRRHEYEADAFAVEACGDPEVMGNALIKLSRSNLSNLTPHPWYSSFHYSHPTLLERLRALKVT